MKIVEDYLAKDLGKGNLEGMEQIRAGYMERAAKLLQNDWQAPAYMSSIDKMAGRREGKVIGNINDYTRDQHDLALGFEKKFVKEYLPRLALLPIEAYVTSSGMAALMTVIVMLQREMGPEIVVMVGKHSYFQNLELIVHSFARVIVFDESDTESWQKLIKENEPRAIFVDSLCNEPDLTRPDVYEIARYSAANLRQKCFLVIDNTMLATCFDWRSVWKWRGKNLDIVGWESLNKYYQFGMDRTTGGVLWGSAWIAVKINQARRHAGTIMSDMAVAMMPTPNGKMLGKYIQRIVENRKRLQEIIGERCIGDQGQIVIKFARKMSYQGMQKIIAKVVKMARKNNVQIAAGTSFGFPTTRIYLTARQTQYSQMFLRVSVGTEESEVIEKIGRIIMECI